MTAVMKRAFAATVALAIVGLLAFVPAATAAPNPAMASATVSQTLHAGSPKVVAKKFSSTPTPKISGKAAVKSKLTAKAGTWKPGTVKLSYQWLRSSKAIKGATKSTYTVTKADAGKKITVKVTGKRSGYTTASKTSKSVTIPAAKKKASVPLKTFKNCTEMRKVHPHGVAKSKSTIDMKNGKPGGGITSKTVVSAKLYDLNKKSDRDKDGWACEA